MPSENSFPACWGTATLEDLTADAPITYGVVQPGAHVPDGVPMLRVNNFKGYRLDTTDVMRIAPEVENKYRRTRVQHRDVLVTVVGSVGQVAVVPKEFQGWNLARAVALVRPQRKELAAWIALCLRSPAAQHALGIAANTTVQTTVNLKDLRLLRVPMPPPDERDAITELLSALDERIDLLRQTNATLESIAQALFTSWFIEFDPVRAKAEGNEPAGMDADTAALFPAALEASTPSTLPQGWTVGQFGEFAKLGKGSVNPLSYPNSEFEHYSLPAFDVDQLPSKELGIAIKSNKTKVPDCSILQSKLNPHIPRVWFTGRVGEQAVCSTEFLPWMAQGSASPEFIYCVLRSEAFAKQVRTLVTGTSNSHQRVKPDQVAALNIVGATAAVRAAFTESVRPILRKVVEQRRHARTLAEVRDALLPRLTSGKLRLPECQEELREMIA